MKAVLDEILADPFNGPVERALGRGMIPVGYTCSMIPEPLLTMGRLFPLRLRAPGVAGTEVADTYLSSVICTYPRSLLEGAMEGRYDFLGGWVFAASCDHLRRLFDNLGYLRKPSFMHILDIPHKSGEGALAWFREELEDLLRRLSAHFGFSAADDAVADAVVRHNEFVSLLAEVGDLRRDEEPLLTGAEFHRIMLTVLTVPREEARELVSSFRDELSSRPRGIKRRARLLLAGAELDDPEYIDAIESQGALVVADRFCTGSLPWLEPVTLNGDPLLSLARHYLNQNRCSRMMEGHAPRRDYIKRLVKEYRADGVVLQSIKFCDTWGVDLTPLASALREEGIPVLRLEREYRLSGEGQLRTRVQAFIESMGK